LFESRYSCCRRSILTKLFTLLKQFMDLIFAISIACIVHQRMVPQQTLHPWAILAVYRPVMDDSGCRNYYASISMRSLYIGGTEA